MGNARNCMCCSRMTTNHLARPRAAGARPGRISATPDTSCTTTSEPCGCTPMLPVRRIDRTAPPRLPSSELHQRFSRTRSTHWEGRAIVLLGALHRNAPVPRLASQATRSIASGISRCSATTDLPHLSLRSEPWAHQDLFGLGPPGPETPVRRADDRSHRRPPLPRKSDALRTLALPPAGLGAARRVRGPRPVAGARCRSPRTGFLGEERELLQGVLQQRGQ